MFYEICDESLSYKIFLCLVSSLFFISTFSLGQCDDGVLNGDEWRIDCGPDCVECFPIWFDIQCNGEGGTGVFDLYFTLPTWMWPEDLFEMGLYYTYEGDFDNNGEPCLSYSECGAVLSFSIGGFTPIDIRCLQKTVDGDELMALGKIDVFYNTNIFCLLNDSIYSSEVCPINSNFKVDVSRIEKDNGYMLKLEMSGGEAPYSIIDLDEELFYAYRYEDDVYYLGLIPNDVELNLAVRDYNNCIFNLTTPPPCNNEWNLLSINSTVDSCSLQDNATGGFILESTIETCNYSFLLNGEMTDSITGLEAGEYSLQIVDAGSLIVDTLEGIVELDEITWDPETACLMSTNNMMFLEKDSEKQFEIIPSVYYVETNLEFYLAEAATLSIEILSIDGQYLESVIEKTNYSAGSHNISINTSSFPKGTNLYLISSSTFDERVILRGLKF